jgi:acyl carrier protein
MEPVPFDTFATRIIDRLHLDYDDPVSPDDGLFTELALDSFQSLELMVIIEAMADVEVPPAVLPEMYTMGDAYRYYQELLAAEAG